MTVQRTTPAVAPQAAAGILLAAASLAGCFGLTCPGADEITAATKVGRSRAYELRRGVLEAAQALLRPVGRPRAEPEPEDTGTQAQLTGAVLAYLATNPGSMYRSGRRRFYADEFRRFVLELRERHAAAARSSTTRATRSSSTSPSSRRPRSMRPSRSWSSGA